MKETFIRPTKEQFANIALQVTNRMRAHTLPYTAAISREISRTEGEHLGSGLYLMLRGEEYLLTNEHVAREIQGQPLAHQLAKEEFATRISNPFQAAPAPYDLALTRIDNAIWSDLKNQRLAVSIQRLALKHEPVEHEFLFTMGYSGERSYFSPTFETPFRESNTIFNSTDNRKPRIRFASQS